MKVKRQKKVGRILSFFRHNFGHRHPFQVILDGTFCQACLAMKINIRDQLPKYLGEVKLLTTKCCILEAEKLGPALSGATMILKQFPIHKCGHEDAPKPAAKCVKSMLGVNNPQRYFVATQDSELRERARKVSGTPILYLHHCAPTLEKPSQMSSDTAEADLERKLTGDYHTRVVAAIKRKEFGEPEGQGPRKKRKQKGVNPLSCLKKKPKSKTPTKKNTDGEEKGTESKTPTKKNTDGGEKGTEVADQNAKKKKRNRNRKKGKCDQLEQQTSTEK